jgi:sugar lactone lactonase YvrE
LRGTLDSGGRKSSKTGLLAAAGLLAALVSAAAGEGDSVAINPASPYPEGPVVVGDTLYYAEMGGDRVMAWDGKENRQVWSREGCGPTSVARGGDGTLIVLCHLGNAVARIRPDGTTVEIIDRDADGKTFTDPNASINDARGGVYFSSSGSFDPKAPSTGAVLYLDAGGKLTRMAEGIHYSNGVALTPDGKTLYVSEHLSRRVLAYDVAADGSLSGKRIFLALDSVEKKQPEWGWEVGPDGLAVDHAGNLYIAEYGGGHLLIVDSRGKLITVVKFKEPYTTAMALADKDRRLFVTAPVSFYDPTAFGEVYEMKNPAFAGD